MSKVVKKVTRTVSKVVKGVSKAVKGVVKGIGGALKKIAGSKIGKVLLAAATIYFGGAAIMGAMGGAGASSGFFNTIAGAVKGAGAGISSAWTGLTGAVTGGGLGSLQSGFMGAGEMGRAAALGSNVATGVSTAGMQGMSQAQALNAQNVGMQGAGQATQTALGSVAPSAATQAGGAGSQLVNTGAQKAGFFSDPLVKYGAITSAAQLGAGALEGYGQEKALRDQERRANENMSTQFEFGDPREGDPQFSGGTGTSGFASMPRRDLPELALLERRGLVAGNMTFGNRNMPVYNPAYAGMPTYRS
jgi:hypothetical protein